MNKILLLFLTVIALASCGDSFKINGTSNISPIDGQKLYLKSLDKDMNIIDSCEVVHGTFNFSGSVDSTELAGIFMGEKQLSVCILDNTVIDVNIDRDETKTKVTGSELNDSLYSFLKNVYSYNYKYEEVKDKHNNAIMDGEDLDVANNKYFPEFTKLFMEEKSTFTDFIKSNFDNILGPTVFNMFINRYINEPQLHIWIEEIMIEATDKFKNDKFVKEFYAKEQEIDKSINDMMNSASNKEDQIITSK